MMSETGDERRPHSVSVVIPVYRGQETLASLVGELSSMASTCVSDDGHPYLVTEVLLVYDHGPDRSDEVIRELAQSYDFVRPVWLSRNFGQHAATLAGMSCSASDWIVTLDEDGQHNPADLPAMLDTALRENATVVYANPTNKPSHGWFRNSTSSLARWTFVRMLSSERQPPFHSYRLVLGEIGRSVAAYAGAGVYLDVGLGWVTQQFATCPVRLRDEGERRSGYSTRTLLSHFWRLVLTSGTRPLRAMSLIGALAAALGFLSAVVVLVGRVSGAIDVQGWASLTIVVLVGFGLTLFTLGIVAEYIGISTGMAMGKPPFLVVSDLEVGPLGQRSQQR